jgi:prepilin-type N-terminal cleavage/methylation domain-containing protein
MNHFAARRGLAAPEDWFGEAGFTLVELLVAIAAMAIVLGGTTTVLIVAFGTQTEVQSQVQLAESAEVGLERMSSDLRSASAACSGSGQPSSAVTVTSSPTTATVEFCEPDPGQALSASSTTDTPGTVVVAWYCNTAVGAGTCRRYSASTASAISSDISANAAAQTTINGVQAVSLSGVLQPLSGSPSTAAQSLSSGSGTTTTAYPLTPTSTTSALSWLGVNLTLGQLANPTGTRTATVPGTQAVQVRVGAELLNFQI